MRIVAILAFKPTRVRLANFCPSITPNPMKTLLISFGFVALAFEAKAQDMVYQPKNPAFGGETFNYNWLLSSAQAQDLTVDKREAERKQESALNDFSASLNRQILNQLSRQLVTSQFGEQGLEEGFYSFGNFQVNVANGLDGLIVTITDTSAGEQTQVTIPYF